MRRRLNVKHHGANHFMRDTGQLVQDSGYMCHQIDQWGAQIQPIFFGGYRLYNG